MWSSTLVDELNYDKNSITPRDLVRRISDWKNRMRTPAQLRETQEGHRDALYINAFEQYEKVLRRASALDFDDLLLRTVSLLREHDRVREKYASRYRHVLVDEYQDTNHAQYALTHLLGRDHRNVCAVGDPDQAIYGWRGADIGNIRQFTRDFPEHTIVHLERNYRSSGNIVTAAAALIDHNRTAPTRPCGQDAAQAPPSSTCGPRRTTPRRPSSPASSGRNRPPRGRPPCSTAPTRSPA